jgi:hypothetical protein
MSTELLSAEVEALPTEVQTARAIAIAALAASVTAKPIAKLATDAEVNKELLARFPFGDRAGTIYQAWRYAIAFHRAERRKLAHFEARPYV